MHLVILTQYYPPEVGAPQARLSDLASRLAARGHDVTVLTAMPNYPQGRIHEDWRGRVLTEEQTDGVRVLRSWIRPTHSKNRWAQLASYFSFVASVAATAPFRIRRADIVLWESPPLFLTPAARLIAKTTRSRLVMNVSDLWPRSAIDLGVLTNPRLVRLFEAWERWSYRTADLVTCQTEGIVAGVRDRWVSTTTLLYPNGVDSGFFTPRPRDAATRSRYRLPADVTVVGYAGNFGRAQALDQVVEAARLLAHRDDVWFHLVGSGPCREEIVAAAQAAGLSRVCMSEPVPRAEVPDLMASWDISVVPLAGGGVFEGARPSKMFELFAMELPFVFCGRGEGASLANESGGAVVVPPERPDELAEAIAKLVDAGAAMRREMGERARRFVVERFDREAITGRVETRLQQLTGR